MFQSEGEKRPAPLRQSRSELWSDKRLSYLNWHFVRVGEGSLRRQCAMQKGNEGIIQPRTAFSMIQDAQCLLDGR